MTVQLLVLLYAVHSIPAFSATLEFQLFKQDVIRKVKLCSDLQQSCQREFCRANLLNPSYRTNQLRLEEIKSDVNELLVNLESLEKSLLLILPELPVTLDELKDRLSLELKDLRKNLKHYQLIGGSERIKIDSSELTTTVPNFDVNIVGLKNRIIDITHKLDEVKSPLKESFNKITPVTQLAEKQLYDAEQFLKYLNALLFELEFLENISDLPKQVTYAQTLILKSALELNPTHLPISSIPIIYANSAMFAAFYSGRIKFEIRNKEKENVFLSVRFLDAIQALMITAGRVSTENPRELRLLSFVRSWFALCDVSSFQPSVNFGILQPGFVKPVASPTAADFVKVLQTLGYLIKDSYDVFVMQSGDKPI